MSKHYMEWDRLDRRNLPIGPRGVPVAGKVRFVPPSPQAGKMASQQGFIDLKIRKGVSSGAVAQPSEDVLPPVAPLDAKTKLMLLQSLIAKNSAIQGILPAETNHLPDPTFEHSGKLFQVKQAASTSQPSKTFIEGPQLPLTVEENAEQFGIELRKEKSKVFSYECDLKSDTIVPENKYTQGTVKYTTKEALKDMVQDLPRFTCNLETTGCIIDEVCAPEFDCYTEEIHFLSEECLGRGSYGKVDLCFDSKTRKPFVRKRMGKKTLRTSEVIVPSTLNHHNITKFYGLIQRECEEEGNPTMELLIEYGGWALNKYFQRGCTLTDAQRWAASKQGLAALVHINKYSIVHLDIKPENICITVNKDGSLVLKLTDFGSSRLPQEPLKFVGLTPEYLAPEMCKMFLQAQNPLLDFGLTEEDITGKVDTFAFGLVIMYLYKGYHILVKVINNGNTSYDGVDMETRRLLHQQLMLLMASDTGADSFIHSLIPDECDLEMRDLLTKLTEHKHRDRYSARQALDFIEGREQRIKMLVRPEQKSREPAEHHMIQKQVPLIAMVSDYRNEQGIPGIAEACMESDNGPVRNKTKDALRMKLQPYGKSGKKGKCSKNINSKTIMTQSSVSEMYELRQGIASKQMPMTPVFEFQGLSLGQPLPEGLFEESCSSNSMTERNAPLAQPSMDTSDGRNGVSQQAEPIFGFSAIRPSQSVEPALAFPVRRSQLVEPAVGFSGVRPPAHPRDAGMSQENVVSLGGKATFNVQRSGVQCLNVPQELIQKLIQKKMAERAKLEPAVVVKTEPVEYPEVINIDSSTPMANVGQIAVGQTKNMKTFGESPVQMEEENNDGNIPKFSMFF